MLNSICLLFRPRITIHEFLVKQCTNRADSKKKVSNANRSALTFDRQRSIIFEENKMHFT